MLGATAEPSTVGAAFMSTPHWWYCSKKLLCWTVCCWQGGAEKLAICHGYNCPHHLSIHRNGRPSPVLWGAALEIGPVLTNLVGLCDINRDQAIKRGIGAKIGTIINFFFFQVGVAASKWFTRSRLSFPSKLKPNENQHVAHIHVCCSGEEFRVIVYTEHTLQDCLHSSSLGR